MRSRDAPPAEDDIGRVRLNPTESTDKKLGLIWESGSNYTPREDDEVVQVSLKGENSGNVVIRDLNNDNKVLWQIGKRRKACPEEEEQ